MRKVIAVDFDGTLNSGQWPEIGMPNKRLIRYLRRSQSHGAALILWTCRTGIRLDEAIDWCASQNLYFDYVNENCEEALAFHGTDSRKIWATEYIDDKMNKKFSKAYIPTLFQKIFRRNYVKKGT